MKAPVSLCIIVKNDPLLINCVKSLRDFVEEVVIVDTGSTPENQAIYKELADIFEVYNDCNNSETGLIESFSKARQRSYDLSTKPWVMWADSDDEVIGGENLIRFTSSFIPNENTDAQSILFPYEYAYDGNGQCTLKHYRERLCSNKKHFHWIGPVHEVLVHNDGVKISLLSDDSIIYKHKRQYGNKPVESGRNLRILEKYVAGEGKGDPRQLYYLGLELYNNGFVDRAIDTLIEYVNVSGWDDERVMACLKLVDIYQGLNNAKEGIKWAFKTIEINETWGEGYFALGKLFYSLAESGGHNQHRNWERCVNFIKQGLALPPTKTLLFINPLEREHDIYKYLNLAQNALGDVKGALESTKIGLQKQDDKGLSFNKRLYEQYLAKQEIVLAANSLKEIGTLDQSNYNKLISIINNQPVDVNNTYPQYKKSATYPRDIAPDQFPVATISPHSQAWGIPNSLELDDLPLRMTNDQLQSVVIMMWRQYILHDELLAALSFLEKAPYDVRDTLITQEALIITKKMLGWLQDPELMQKHNAPTDPNTEIDIPMPYPLIQNQSGGRFFWVRDHLPNHKVSIVDFGCVDGCFTNRYAMMGHEVYGLDVVETSVALANKKAQEFNTGAKHIVTYFQDAVGKVPSRYFDYATSTDTYEHLMDPVKDMLLPAKQMLNDDGKFLLSTPYGAWFRGQYSSYAHPWLWANEGESWLCTRPRGHLIAPSSWSVSKHFIEAEYYVYNCHYVPSLLQNVENQGNIMAEAHVKFPPNYPGRDIVFYIGGHEVWTPLSVTNSLEKENTVCKMARQLAAKGNKVRVFANCGMHGEGVYDGVEYYQDHKFKNIKSDITIDKINEANVGLINSILNDIPLASNYLEIIKGDSLDVVFAIGDGVEFWNPQTIKNSGIGGSETMAMEMAKRLAALGNRVRVYNSCGQSGVFDRVEYYPTQMYNNLTCDVLVVSRNAAMLDDSFNIQAKLRLLWVHDIYAINATNALLLKADRILALSEWHKQNLIYAHNINPDHIIVTRNGIDLTRFDKKLIRDKYRAINSSSPDRSWITLLDCWPHIKAKVSKAELHLFYGFKNWEYSATEQNGQKQLIIRLKQQIKELEPLGVVYHDRVSQDQLAEEFLKSGVWAHPTWFTETSCITAMEAQAAGLRMVTSSIAALNETVGNRGILLNGDWMSYEYRNNFIDSVVDSMNRNDGSDRVTLQKYAAENFGLDSLAQDWDKMFHSLISDIGINPLVPYYPTIRYR